MANIFVLNYDDVLLFTKHLRDEGEDIVQLYSNTRQRMHMLRDEWSGEAAETFYNEMISELLPALKRVSMALFLCNEVLIKIMKIIHNADEETATFFNDDLHASFGFGEFSTAFAGNRAKNQSSPIYPTTLPETFSQNKNLFSENGDSDLLNHDSLNDNDK